MGQAWRTLPMLKALPRGPQGHLLLGSMPAIARDQLGFYAACARVEHYNTYRHGGGEVWVLPAGGGEGRSVASGVGFHQGMALAWCTDSRRLLYVSSHMMMTGRMPRLMRASLDGGAPVSLTESFDRFVGHGPGSHTDLRFGSGPVPVAARPRPRTFSSFSVTSRGSWASWSANLSRS